MTNTSATLRLTPRPQHPDNVYCTCNKLIYDAGEHALMARVTYFTDAGAMAKCKVCRALVPVPVRVVPDIDLSWARFALGWWTQEMVPKVPLADIAPLMQSFLNLLADGCGEPRPLLAHVLAAEESVSPTVLEEARQRWPSLMPPET